MRIAIVALLLSAVGATPISDAIREHVAPEMLHPIRELHCPETAEETSGAFRCSGVMIDGQPFTVDCERGASGSITTKIIHFEGPELAIHDEIAAWVPGTLRDFDCPDSPEATAHAFQCHGTTSDGSVFTVDSIRTAPRETQTQQIVYDATKPSAFVNAVRDYLKSDAPPQSIRCPLDESPQLFTCEVVAFGGRRDLVRVARQRDGAMRIVAVVIPHRTNPYTQAAGAVLMALGIGIILTGVVLALGVRERLIVTQLPLQPQQTVHFEEAGPYVLQTDGPRFTLVFWRLDYALVDAATNIAVPSSAILVPVRTDGFATIRRSVCRFDVPHPGDYVLFAQNLDPKRVTPDATLIFSKPWPLIGFVWVALAVAGGLTAIAGLFTILVA